MTHPDDAVWTDETPDDQQFAGDDLRRVIIDAGHGDLDVAWHGPSAVLVHGPSTEALRQDDTLIIHRRRKGGRLVVTLPTSLPACTINVQHGRLTLIGSRGEVQAGTGSGSVHVSDGQADLTIHTGSGSLHIDGHVGPLSGQTGSGSIHLASVTGEIRVHTGSGSIRIIDGAGAINARTGSGAIRVEDRSAERLTLNTGSGSININDGQAGATDVRTGSGSIKCSAILGPSRHDMATNSGTITLGVPRGLPARIEATTSQGRIDTDLPLVTVGQRGPKSMFGRRLVGSLGEGSPRAEISLRTGRGDIRLSWLDGIERFAPPASSFEGDLGVDVSNIVGDVLRSVTGEVSRVMRDVSVAIAPDVPPAWPPNSSHSSDAPPTSLPPPPPPPTAEAPVPPSSPLPVGWIEPAFVPAPPPPPPTPAVSREARQRHVLAALATGDLTVAEAERLLAALDAEPSPR